MSTDEMTTRDHFVAALVARRGLTLTRQQQEIDDAADVCMSVVDAAVNRAVAQVLTPILVAYQRLLDEDDLEGLRDALTDAMARAASGGAA